MIFFGIGQFWGLRNTVVVGFSIAESFHPIVAGFNNVGNFIGKSVIKGGRG